MINLVVALECEAMPFVDYFCLRPDVVASGLRVYSRADLRLVVTGMGKTRAASRCRQLCANGYRLNRAWLNVGIAGHRDLEIGTGVWAQYVKDKETGRVWSLATMQTPSAVVNTVCTVMNPDLGYPEDLVLDMEASGFCESVTAYSPDAVIQCYKVISDNRASGVAAVTPAAVSTLMKSHVQPVAEAVSALAGLLTASRAPFRQTRP